MHWEAAMTSPDLVNRIQGCIVGGAIGDALGGPYEGQPGPVVLEPGAPWYLSDDTQLTLATCEAVSASAAIAPAAIAEHFVRWYRQGRITGVGASTRKALQDLAAGAHWALSGRNGERGAGNGAAMRIAPLAFCLDPRQSEQRTILRDVCRITHHNDEAYVGAVAVVLAIRAIAFEQWQPGELLLRRITEELPDTTVRERLLAISEVKPGTPLVEVGRTFGCSGYVAESVPLAIYAAQQIGPGTLGQLLRDVVQIGGDTDTNAAIAGQIAGAWCGLNCLPANLVRELPEIGDVVAIADDFAATVVDLDL
jgi:ADP-ribosylglycohydrolase